ncbi:MAG: SDR family NAD(P)-dependent oxidoreductase [Ornithinimicrobium sp.]|jgi:NAD(P)-dependent dehydrogenase (short-subunit alcohol dehydrogenase family)|uniref:SDR family NAD(P)-dependent oxidoreductase n=1 Tax=Ornithinimicrobium sp. TaxID=1977084 RepID=UPI003D9AFDE2
MSSATTDKVALVTGASRGIGAHLATALAQDGYAVAALARSQGSLTELTERLRGGGVTVLPLACDVTDADSVAQVVRQVTGELGRIDLLVNNAGLIEDEVPIWEADADQWWQVLVTNVRGPFLMIRAVVPVMIEQGGGRIVNMNSGAGTKENPVLTAYTASKSALGRITGGTAAAGAEHGVLAFDLAPGVVQTDMTASMDMHQGRTEWTDPQDVTELLLALASGDLDAWSGRMVRAGSDPVEKLRELAAQGLPDTARLVRLLPWGEDDPVAD